jgi:hypothetical protein
MQRILALLICFAMLFHFSTNAQEQKKPSDNFETVSMGIGAGFDYGGFGGNLTVYPQKNIGLFAGVGYAIAGLGYNVGAKFRVVSRRHFTPYAVAMYGYNAAVAVPNYSEDNKLFYGPSIGAGFDVGTHHVNGGYFSFAILVPIRSPDVNNYIDYLKNNGVTFNNNLMPIAFSIGYRFVVH